ncbi:MAG: hypothetical protein KKB20_18930 [Proteobacteria bacterium]|nr:hypothetical protein [Pseudomonadota bacterium]
METVSLAVFVQIFSALGPFGIVVLMWWLDMKNMRSLLDQHRADVSRILQQHREYMTEIRNNYQSSVSLVESYQSVARDLKDLIVMNTEAMTRLAEAVNQNQFCPMQRVEKRVEIHGVDS